MTRPSWLAAGVAAILLMAAPATAAPLLGTQVTGSLTFAANPVNFYDPNQGFVPFGCLNETGTTVTISEPDVEFCFFDGNSQVAANFTDASIIITDEILFDSVDWTQVFTDAAFAGLTFVEVTDTFVNGGVELVQVGDELRFTWAGSDDPGTFRAVYEAQALTPVPEPATLSLLGAGLAAWRLRARRRAVRS